MALICRVSEIFSPTLSVPNGADNLDDADDAPRAVRPWAVRIFFTFIFKGTPYGRAKRPVSARL